MKTEKKFKKYRDNSSIFLESIFGIHQFLTAFLEKNHKKNEKEKFWGVFSQNIRLNKIIK